MATSDSTSPATAPPEGPPDCTSRMSFWPLFGGIAGRLVLFLAVGVVLLGAWGMLGRYFGVSDLFWHQDGLTQILAGLGAALLLGQVCFVSYLLDGDYPSLEKEPRPAPSRGLRRLIAAGVHRLMVWLVPEPTTNEGEAARAWRKLRWYLSVTWFPLVVLLILPALVYVSGTPPAGAEERASRFHVGSGGLLVWRPAEGWYVVVPLAQRWYFLVGVLLAAVFGRYFVKAFHALYARIWERWKKRLPEVVSRLPPALLLHVLTVVLFVLLFWVFWDAPTEGLALLLVLWAAVHGLLVSLFRVARVPEGERWKHLLAGATFGVLLFIYGAFGLWHWAAPNARATTLLISPAAVLCLLLGMLVLAHGFLRFHFRGWYSLVMILLLVVVVVLNGFLPRRHEFPGLEGLPLLDLERMDLEAVASSPAGDEEKVKRLQPLYAKLKARLSEHIHGFERPVPIPTHPGEPQTFAAMKKRCEELKEALAALERERLRVWQEALASAKKGGKPRLAVVAVSGGGNRSAMWTALVLERLAGKLPDFHRHVRLISGASGGMVGAAHFTANLSGEKRAQSFTDEDLAARVGGDALTPIAQRLLFVDMPAAFMPHTTTTDRGRALEEAWLRNMGKVLDRTFRDLAEGEARGWRPSLVFSPMLVEDGRRLLISNLYLPELAESAGPLLTRDAPGEEAPGEGPEAADSKDKPRPKAQRPGDGRRRYSVSAVEFFQLFPERKGQFQVSTAVRMSATFPYVSPAVDLPTEPRRRVVDAGYYDNYGVNVAASWIGHHRQWLAENTSGVVLIQVRDSASEYRRLYAGADEGGWELARGLEWLTGPLAGAGSAIDSMMSFRNDEQVEALGDYFNGRRPEFFTTAVLECSTEIALSWRGVTAGELAQMQRDLDGTRGPNVRTLERLREWWGQ